MSAMGLAAKQNKMKSYLTMTINERINFKAIYLSGEGFRGVDGVFTNARHYVASSHLFDMFGKEIAR